MMYQDSIDQAGEKAALAIAFLQRHRLAAHPVNYTTVAYDYITGANAGPLSDHRTKTGSPDPV